MFNVGVSASEKLSAQEGELVGVTLPAETPSPIDMLLNTNRT